MRTFSRSLAAAALLFALSGCKQQEGERCQINSDCADGLTCFSSTMTCGTTGSDTPDAAQPADAGGPDAVPPPDVVTPIDAALIDVAE